MLASMLLAAPLLLGTVSSPGHPQRREPAPAPLDSPAGAPDGAESRGLNLADIPSPELALSAPLGGVSAHDTGGSVHGRSTGELAMLSLESFTLRAAYSSNSGASFGAEVVAAGAPTDGPVVGYRSALAPDGRLYVAYTVGDPGGDVGIRFRRSDDLGRTWTAPVDLVQRGDPNHGCTLWAIDANASGRVAVVFQDNWEGRHINVRTSSSAGAAGSWTPPVQVSDPWTTSSATEGEIAVAPNGTVHAVWVESNVFPSVYTRRSLDGGATFLLSTNLTSVVTYNDGSGAPDAAVAADGSVLVAFYDLAEGVTLGVVRSADDGATWVEALDRRFLGSVNEGPRLLPSPSNGTVLLAYRVGGTVTTSRSTNHGAAFGAPVNLAGASKRAFSLSRTSAGRWLLATENASSTALPVYVSTDDGASWGTPATPNTASTLESNLLGITGVGSDSLFVLYQDPRPSNGTDYNLWCNRSAASPLNFGTNERRADTDGGQDNRLQSSGATIASDGAQHVYAALFPVVTGPGTDLYVGASADGGSSFGTPVRVSAHAAGSGSVDAAQLSAQPDGRVYALYAYQVSTFGVVTRSVAFRRSLDFGASWQSAVTLATTLTNFDSLRIASLPGGEVYLVWSNGGNISFARSTDSGATFSTTLDFDGQIEVPQAIHTPRLCAQGTQVVVVFRYPADNSAASVYARTSNDRGATFTPTTSLRPGHGGFADQPEVACDGATGATAVWRDSGGTGNGFYKIYSSRLDGAAWQPPVRVVNLADRDLWHPLTVYTGPGTLSVISHDYEDHVVFSRSQDSGATFAPEQFLDAAAPQPPAWSTFPYLVTDGQGNLWASWSENSAGNGQIYRDSFYPDPQIAMAHSTDHGVTWSPIRRLNREQPQGAKANWLPPGTGYPLAAVPGRALAIWTGERSSSYWETLVNGWQAGDLDRDGVPTPSDCDDADPAAGLAPTEIAGLALEKVPSATRLSWVSQDPTTGPGTAYDVVSGALADLRASGGFAAANCLQDDHADTPYDDTRLDPEPGSGVYYLLRAQVSAACAGTFGDSGLATDPRDGLDATSPCP